MKGRKVSMALTAPILLALLMLALLLLGLTSPPAMAKPPAPGDVRVPAVRPIKPIDRPNPLDHQRNMNRQHLMEAGKTAQADALALTGSDRVLVILVEFAGTDVFTWTPGSTWDPLGKANPNEDAGIDGDCSNIIATTQTFTYTGPLHNAIPRPLSPSDPSGDSVWTSDFNSQWFENFMFGNGVEINYTAQDGTPIYKSFLGKSVRDYFHDFSANQYDIDGDVIGWLQLPHSTWWYAADECPGRRSQDPGTASDEAGIPDAGSYQSLVMDSLDALNAISNTIPGFDWANYDKDGDGLIDRLWLVHAGYGEEDSTVLLNRDPVSGSFYGEAAAWSHSFSVYPPYSVTQDIAAYAYIMMPENGGIGVFAHESAHNLGADDLYSYGEGETSTGFWALQSDDWTGYPIGFQPPSPDPWHLDNWGWLDPYVISDTAQVYTVTVGQASDFPGGSGVYRGVKIQLPPGQTQLAAQPDGDYYWWGGQEVDANAMMTTANYINLTAAVTAELSFDLAYNLEEEWDYLWVQVSTGTTWSTLTNTHTTCDHAEGWVGANYDFPDDMCAAGIGGFTGEGASFPDLATETFDLSAYAGQSIRLRFWYMTDAYVLGDGPFVDNVRVTSGGSTVFFDDAEAGDANWDYAAPWQRSEGLIPFSHNYYLQWRNTGADGGYDSSLGDPRWRFGPANSGLLVWYNDNLYSDNEILNYVFDAPSFGPKGRMLVVDSHPEPYQDPYYVQMGFDNEAGNVSSRALMRDAPFSLNDAVPFTMTTKPCPSLGTCKINTPYSSTPGWVYTPTAFAGRPAASSFHDSFGYYPGAEYVSRGPGYVPPSVKWIANEWDASVVIPATTTYALKAPGYMADDEFRFGCLKNLEGSGVGKLPCYVVSLDNDGGTGNPGDDSAQYGWHVQILAQTAQTATLKIWNAQLAVDHAFSVDRTRASLGDAVQYTYVLTQNWGSPLDLFTCIPLDTTKAEFVTGSNTGGAIPLLASCPATVQALAGGEALGQVTANAGAPVLAIGWIKNLATAETGGTVGFQVKTITDTGILSMDAQLFRRGLSAPAPAWVTLPAPNVLLGLGENKVYLPVVTKQ